MTGQQGGAPGQPGSNPPQDQESTQVGMPVPPVTPAYTQQPPPPYGQPPVPPPPPPGYGAPPPGGYPPAGYGYQTPPPKRGGPSALLIGAIALALVLALGVGGMYVLGLGPFAPSATPTAGVQATPTPSQPAATASLSPSPTATEAAPSPTDTLAPETTAPATTAPATTAPATTAPATSSPSFTLPPISFPPFSPGPSASPTEAEAALLLHVPEEFQDSCSSAAVIAPALASLNCNAGLERGIFVSYTQYADLASMQAAYQTILEVYGADAGSEDCATAANWPSQYGYTINDVHAGRVLCSEFGTLPQMHWTDERFNILTWSFGLGDVTKEDMHAFWSSEAGPN